MNFPTTKNQNPKAMPPTESLGFGQYFTDHMFLMDYSPDKGWHDPRIVPHGPLSLDPAAMVLHYGQEVFEGLKAYRDEAGGISFFRPMDNVQRFNRSCERAGIPPLDEALFMDALHALISVEQHWVPSAPDTSLYIRPYVVATDPFVGVRSSNNYLFVILLSPVGAYYPGGLAPTKILVESEDVRAAQGGLGSVKAGANYAATIRAQTRAKTKGYTQVMWLDAKERRYVDEVGTSNAFFVIGGTVVTPPLNGAILPGITRDSCLQLLKHWGIPVEERPIAIDEVFTAHKENRLEECFATGTAAVVSPVGELCYQDQSITIGGGKTGPVAQRLYDALTGIQWSRLPDEMGWRCPLRTEV